MDTPLQDAMGVLRENSTRFGSKENTVQNYISFPYVPELHLCQSVSVQIELEYKSSLARLLHTCFAF